MTAVAAAFSVMIGAILFIRSETRPDLPGRPAPSGGAGRVAKQPEPRTDGPPAVVVSPPHASHAGRICRGQVDGRRRCVEKTGDAEEEKSAPAYAQNDRTTMRRPAAEEDRLGQRASKALLADLQGSS